MEGRLEDYQQQFHSGKILGKHVLKRLDPKPGMRVLDLGCGDGHLTRQIADAGAKVVGVDLDASFVAAAVAIGIDAKVVDGQQLDFIDEFDRVFSNATLHWLSEDPVAVINGVHRALRSGGQFIAEFGGEGNVETIVRALESAIRSHGHDPGKRNPWFFPSAEKYASMLSSAGFIVRSCELVDARTPLPPGADMSGWLQTFCSKWLSRIDGVVAESILRKVSEMLAQTHLLKDGQWYIDYVRIRVVAQKPQCTEGGEPPLKLFKADSVTDSNP